jgi:hypothetical protein
LKADEIRFVKIEDAFPITNNILKSWDYSARITKQTKINLNNDQTLSVLEYLRSKPDSTTLYISETQRLQPHGSEEDDENDEE